MIINNAGACNVELRSDNVGPHLSLSLRRVSSSDYKMTREPLIVKYCSTPVVPTNMSCRVSGNERKLVS
jgi:hypothetical protein